MCFRFGSKNWMEIAETTENEIIGVLILLKVLIILTKLLRLTVSGLLSMQKVFNDITLLFTERKTRKFISHHFCGCQFQPFKPEK